MNTFFKDQLSLAERDNCVLGRVVKEFRTHFELRLENGELKKLIKDKKLDRVDQLDQRPCVGDYVMAGLWPGTEFFQLKRILARKSKIIRKVAGSGIDGQVIATNIDKVLIVNSLNRDLNLRRIERYLIMAFDGL